MRALLLVLVTLMVGCPGKPSPQPPKPPAPQPDPEDVVEEGDEHVTPPPTEGPPLIYGEEIDGAETLLTFGTWNLNRFTAKKAIEPFTAIPGTGTKVAAVFKVLDEGGVDLAALQEIYWTNGDPLQGMPSTWQKIDGPEIFAPTKERCVIVFEPKDVSCSPVKNLQPPTGGGRWVSGGRGINWALCTAVADPDKTPFYFGCAHFAYEHGELALNITNFFTNLTQPGPGPNLGNANPANRDNFVLGLDGNSHPNANTHARARHRRTWNTQADNLRGPNGTGPLIVLAPIAPTGPQFSKLRMSGGSPKVSSRNPFLDDLIWHLKEPDPLKYEPGSKRMLEVRTLFSNPANYLVDFYPLADHLPQVADYTVKVN